MNSKTIKVLLTIIALIIIAVAAFSGGFLAANTYNALKASDDQALPSLGTGDTISASSSETSARDTLFAPFWESWNIVHEIFVDQPVDDTKLMRGAIQGMLAALGDKHTTYMDPDELVQASISIDGEYEGIGAWVDITGDYLVIISPMPDSPAEKAGLKPDDQVIGIDGEDMTGIDGNIVLNKILGPAGTPIVLTIRRDGVAEPFDVSITRAHIVVPSVTGKMLDNTSIAYVRIDTFGDTTGQELEKALQDLLENSPTGVILDLRYNGGGLLTSAVDVSSQFLSPGVVMYEQLGDGTMNELRGHPGGLILDLPLIVLVNDGTASASEIVAGAIQDYGRGQLVGIQTYGKGSVQNWIELENNQGAVRVTIARWLTPLKRQIHEIGLTPDFIVEITEEDIANNLDPQLDKAIELLSK